MNDRPIAEDDLHAYVDGRLDAARRAVVEAYLAGNPEAAAKVAAWRAQVAALHAAFDPVLREPIPARLRRGRPPLWPRLARHAAAAALYLLIGFAVGYGLEQAEQDGWATATAPVAAGSFPERAAVAHVVYAPEVRHPVEVLAKEEAHLAAWLSKRLGTRVRVPKLAEAGYELVGGRLLPDAAGMAGQFMYEDAQGRRVTLYLKVDEAARNETAFLWARVQDVEVCFWIDRRIGYALAGAVDRKELDRLAHIIYRQLNV
jgi:anti-sigma factor RsiW